MLGTNIIIFADILEIVQELEVGADRRLKKTTTTSIKLIHRQLHNSAETFVLRFV